MSLDAWIAFCVTETALCLSPGPAVLLVVSMALTRGPRPGLAAAAGILAANAGYFALSATGVAALIVASSELFTALKWTGAAYLIWLGLRMLRTRPAPAVVAPQHGHRAFARGFVVQAANPKALVFFMALVPQFLDPASAVGVQVLILGVSSVLIELIVLTAYVAASVRARRFAGARLAVPLERVGGAFLVLAGGRLAFVRTD